jgi:predicted DNA repair protein MutK
VITLSTVIDQHFAVQVMVVTLISLLATIGVYGLVALLVRMDDTGYYLMSRAAARNGSYAHLLELAGQLLVDSLPVIIRLLGVIGTIAMLLVGGGMFVHNIEAVHHWLEMLPSLAAELLTGLVVGMILLGIMHLTRLAKEAVV